MTDGLSGSSGGTSAARFSLATLLANDVGTGWVVLTGIAGPLVAADFV